MVYVIAIITAKPGKREEFLEAYREVVPHVRAEPGCLEYGPLIPTVIWVPNTVRIALS